MIKVVFYKSNGNYYGFRESGHSGYDEAGKDIVCAAVSEIHVVPREYGNFELVLIPLKAHLRVLADRILDEDTLQKMMVTLDVVTGLDRDVDVIDLRYGSISYHSRSSK